MIPARLSAPAVLLALVLALGGLTTARAVAADAHLSAPTVHTQVHPKRKLTTFRARRFARRWGRAVNHKKWHWVRKHTNGKVSLKVIKGFRDGNRLHFEHVCEVAAPKTDKLCYFDEAEVQVHERPGGRLFANRYAVYA